MRVRPPDACRIQRATGSFSQPVLSTSVGQGALREAAASGSSPASVAAEGGARSRSTGRHASSLTVNGRPNPSAKAIAWVASPARREGRTHTGAAPPTALPSTTGSGARRRRSTAMSAAALRKLTEPAKRTAGLFAQARAVMVSLTLLPDAGRDLLPNDLCSKPHPPRPREL